ncbi:crotonase/enoyl-CoA hydratase family protein [Pontivivens insulae]|nr:crotonase/enoyl-CoA hydratase family protein [Pontivivens insulae]
MTFTTLDLSVASDGIATLRLNRPEKHNALSEQMIGELTEAANALNDDDAIRVVILTGAGRSFCAGGDLGWMKSQFAADRAGRMASARALAGMLHTLNTLRKPLIGQINGAAFGGGVGMASVCDVAIAAESAMFGLTETRLGLIPATISPYVLARMGEGKARRVFMSARRFGADEARALDLVARVVPDQDLEATVRAEAEDYLKVSPAAVASAKALARRLGPAIDEHVIEMTANALADTWESPDAQAGISAFFDRVDPPWVQQPAS